MPDGLSGEEQAIYFSKVRKFFDSYACSRVMERRKKMSNMTVQEFYDWCKARKLTDAVMEISLKFAGLDMHGVKVNEMNIDYGLRKLPNEDAEKYIRLGG